MTPAEHPLWIAVNGIRRIVLSCSPHEPGALVLGHLLSEGWIRSLDDVASLSVVTDEPQRAGVAAEIDGAQLEATEMIRHHQTLHGCGTRHFLDCDPFALPLIEADTVPADVSALVRTLFDAGRERAPDGGVHTCALSDGAQLFAITTDVARHCAVDRAIGLGIRERHDLSGLGLVTTARVSGAMATKAIRARLAWVASRSVATTLAHEIASGYGLVLYERAARPAAS